MLETRSRERMLLEAGLSLSSQLSLDAVLQRIVDLAVAITQARYGALGVVGRDGQISQFVTTGISEEGRKAIGHLPVGKGILGLLIEDARPLRLAKIADHARSVGFPPNHPAMRSFLGAPVKARGRVFGNIYLTDKQGATEFGEEDEEAVVILAAQAGVAIENARLYEEARMRERRLDAVREITESIIGGDDTQEVLRLVARRARQLLGADLATIATPTDDETLRIEVAEGDNAARLRNAVFPVEGSISGEVIRTARAVVLEDASTDPRTYQPVVRLGDLGPAIYLPLLTRGRAYGTLCLANMRGRSAFTEEDLSLVESFAAQASVALEYGRAQQELRRLEVLEDRERIAKELHDGVIQALFAVGMGLQAAALLSENEELRRRIESGVEDIDTVIRDLRHYIFGLRPGVLTDRGLDQALRSLARDLEEKAGVATVVDAEPSVLAELTPVAAHIIQLTREALSNVGRHADAQTCRVTVRRHGSAAVLEIEDDGKGFDPGTAVAGQGLGNLRSRAESLGGTMDLESKLGDGTAVRISIPL